MNLRKTIYNALNVRGLQKSPPPICRNNVNNKLTGTANPHSSLLHQAYASCGRAFSCLSLKGALCALVCLFALSFAACEKEDPYDDAHTRTTQADTTKTGSIDIIVNIDVHWDGEHYYIWYYEGDSLVIKKIY